MLAGMSVVNTHTVVTVQAGISCLESNMTNHIQALKLMIPFDAVILRTLF